MVPLPELFAKQWRNCGIRLGALGVDRGDQPCESTAMRRDCYVVVGILAGETDLNHAIGGRLTLTSGELCLMPPGYGYHEVMRPVITTAGSESYIRFMADVTVIAPGTVEDPLLALGLPRVVSLPVAAVSDCVEAMCALYDGWSAPHETAALHARFEMDRLLADYLETGFASGVLRWSTEAAPEWLVALRYWMGDNVKQPGLTIDDLAKACGYSASHVQHAFKTYFNTSPLRYLRRLRMDLAAKLLTSTPSLSVADVAYRSGYRDASLFARHFRSVTGTSPRQFRKGD